ncbi:hypothetical protein ACFXPS_43495 [Nocardia sp. NPDC059091]|uniref:hypothetical protein n=1 Tax=Nocardia sp. NPDC059091 TaxID=3346724 RepID=UPI00369D5789
MNCISFCGTIEHSASERISSVVMQWLGTSRVDVKERMFGFELSYQDSSVDFYCYEATVLLGVDPFFLIEGVMEQVSVDPVEKLAGLVRLAAAEGLECILDYTPVDSDGSPTGAEMTITPEQVQRARLGLDRARRPVAWGSRLWGAFDFRPR